MKIRHLNTEEQNAGLEQIRQAPTDDGSLELSGSRERWPLAGDQLYIDLDLSLANLPAGTLPGHRRGNGRSHLPAPYQLQKIRRSLRHGCHATRQQPLEQRTVFARHQYASRRSRKDSPRRYHCQAIRTAFFYVNPDRQEYL